MQAKLSSLVSAVIAELLFPAILTCTVFLATVVVCLSSRGGDATKEGLACERTVQREHEIFRATRNLFEMFIMFLSRFTFLVYACLKTGRK